MASPRRPRLVAALVALAVLSLGLAACSDDDGAGLPVGPEGRRADAAVERTGELDDGTRWRLRAPAAEDWNGTLLLYSRGSVPPGQVNAALDAPDETTARLLLEQGFALVGSSYAEPGWVLASAVEGAPTLRDIAVDALGEPERTVAWGHSLGGLVTVALAEQGASDVEGAMAACGIVGGPDLLWDPFLDVTFVLRTLLVPPDRPLELAGFRTSPELAQAQLRDAGGTAMTTPQGQARVALAAAVADVPMWAPGAATPPADPASQIASQAAWISVIVPMSTAFRADMERRVGGNPSSNVGIDYAALLEVSRSRPLVEAAYAAAGLDLDADLAALAAAPRIRADAAARRELLAPVEPTGRLAVPLLTLHGTADGLALPFHTRAFAGAVASTGRQDQLRQAAVDRPGHCTFTAAEQVAALAVVLERLETGTWPDTSAEALNAAAATLGADANVTTAPDGTTVPLPAAFVDGEPSRPPRAAATTLGP